MPVVVVVVVSLVLVEATRLQLFSEREIGGDRFIASRLTDREQLFVIGDVAHRGTHRRTDHADDVEAEFDIPHRLHRAARPGQASAHVDECVARVPASDSGDRRPRFLDDTHGPVPGVEDDRRYGMGSTPSHAGDTLLLVSDGLAERRGTGLDAGCDRLPASIPLGAQRPRALVGLVDCVLHLPGGLVLLALATRFIVVGELAAACLTRRLA